MRTSWRFIGERVGLRIMGAEAPRFAAAVLLAWTAAVGSVAGAVVGAMTGGLAHSVASAHPYNPWGVLVIGVSIAAIAGPLTGVTVGATLHAFLMDVRAQSVWWYLLAGALPGVLLALGGAFTSNTFSIAWIVVLSGATLLGELTVVAAPLREARLACGPPAALKPTIP